MAAGIGIAMQGIGALSKIAGGIAAKKRAKEAQRKAEAKERQAQFEMNRMKDIYSSLDTSNPYLNMENKMEDLTVNQQQAQFQQQQFQQQQDLEMTKQNAAIAGSPMMDPSKNPALADMLTPEEGAGIPPEMVAHPPI